MATVLDKAAREHVSHRGALPDNALKMVSLGTWRPSRMSGQQIAASVRGPDRKLHLEADYFPAV